MADAIRRVGLTAKRGLTAASDVLAELAGWLEAHDVQPVFERETALLAGVPAGRPTASADDLPHKCDLIVVLGGDGTLIGVANRIARAGTGVPILGVNFGSLGFLTEIRIDELYPSLDSAVEGTARYDERLMLSAVASRRGKPDECRVVLNDVVFTKGALSRMIELSVSVSGRFVTRD